MSDLTKLLQEHSATRLLHNPTRHVCAGCGQAITGTMSAHQADVLDLAGYRGMGATVQASPLAKAAAYVDGYRNAWNGRADEVDYFERVANHFERLHDKTADRLRAARALVREQRDTIAAQDALIDGMRKTLTQQRAMAETLVALS